MYMVGVDPKGYHATDSVAWFPGQDLVYASGLFIKVER